MEDAGLNEYGLIMKAKVKLYAVLVCWTAVNVIASLLEARIKQDKLVDPLLQAGAFIRL